MSSKMCAALSPSPIPAKAKPSHAAACVYCPPFSRIPGGYALIYPGSRGVSWKGGQRSRISRSSSRTNSREAASTATRARSEMLPPASTAHDCVIESMRHSSEAAEPVHPVIPVARADKWQAVRALRNPALQRTLAVLEQRPPLRGRVETGVAILFVLRERRPAQERNLLTQDRQVAGRFDIVARNIG